MLLGVLASVGAGAVYVVHYANLAPPLSKLRAVVAETGTPRVFASNSTPLGYIESDTLRTPVTTSEIPPDLMNATVAIEDQRFYQH